MQKEELLQALSTCIGFETTNGKNDEKQNCLDWLETTFFTNWKHDRVTGEEEGSPYLYFENPNAKWLWFAHLDVVPAEEHQFSLQMEGDKAIGRGVKDMKGSALPFLFALRDELKEGRDPSVSILLTTDEETAGLTIPNLLKKNIVSADIAFTPDTGSSPWIVHEHKGVVWVDLIAEGTGCHGALPWNGDNPIWKLAGALNQLNEVFPAQSEDSWGMTVSPAQLKGSSARNKTPYECRCSLDIRYTNTDAKNAAEVVSLLTSHLPTGCRIEVVKEATPLCTDPKHPFILKMQSIASDVLGIDVAIGREHGCTDARYFSEQGIPAFLFGPVGDGLHGKDEWVSISSLLDHYAISKKLLERVN